MTYAEARRWLAKIGGSWMEAREPSAPRLRRAIIVSVRTAKGQVVQRHATYDDGTESWVRESEIRHAFARACEELKEALA